MSSDPKPGTVFAHVLQQFRRRRRQRQPVIRRFGVVERRFLHFDVFRLGTHEKQHETQRYYECTVKCVIVQRKYTIYKFKHRMYHHDTITRYCA